MTMSTCGVMPPRARSALLCCLLALAPPCACITFELAPGGSRCVSELLQKDAILTGEWSVPNQEYKGQTEFDVRSGSFDAAAAAAAAEPSAVRGRLFHSGEASGHFSVKAAAAGAYSVCVKNIVKEGVADSFKCVVTLTLRTALEVEDHHAFAKKEHVEAIEAELDRMERMAEHVYEEMNTMRARSELAHETDASTRGRLLWVEVAMLCTLLLMGLWQITYLKRYFQSKKIL